jgi:hypothetical protein
LPAKAVGQAMKMLDVPQPSQASLLPQWVFPRYYRQQCVNY